MAEHEEIIERFKDITGVDEEQARFYLESALWQLEVALVSFYENENEIVPEGTDDAEASEISGSDSRSVPPKPTPVSTASVSVGSSRPIQSNAPRFATVSSLTRDQSSDEEEGQAFYAGGSEHSGQQLLGPGKKKRNSFVAEIFKSFQEHGAEIVEASNIPITRKTATFSGVGYRLGQTSTDTEVVGASDGASSSNRDINVTLKMWNDGFSINEGPLRRYSDPDTREFLESIDHGEVPDELLQEAQGGEVHLYMEDHSHEDFIPVKPKLKAFSGKGNVLGSPTPHTVVAPTSTSDQDKASNEDKAKELVAVDTTEPTTTIQIRLADGTRLVATLNQSHTIGDLRNYIVAARPEYENRHFNLMTTFPSKELDDDSQTLTDAGILNSAIMQRLM